MNIFEILESDIIDTEKLFNLIPELRILEISQVNHPAHKYNVLIHTLESVKLVDDKILKISLLFHDIGKPYCTIYDKK